MVYVEGNKLAGAGFHQWRKMKEILTLKTIELGDFSNSVETLEKR